LHNQEQSIAYPILWKVLVKLRVWYFLLHFLFLICENIVIPASDPGQRLQKIDAVGNEESLLSFSTQNSKLSTKNDFVPSNSKLPITPIQKFIGSKVPMFLKENYTLNNTLFKKKTGFNDL
jgi:hypothetical protein